jgi:hypothetical protein
MLGPLFTMETSDFALKRNGSMVTSLSDVTDCGPKTGLPPTSPEMAVAVSLQLLKDRRLVRLMVGDRVPRILSEDVGRSGSFVLGGGPGAASGDRIMLRQKPWQSATTSAGSIFAHFGSDNSSSMVKL